MNPTKIRLVVASAALLLPAIGKAQSIRGIGDLSGGNVQSFITAISGDGKTIVGDSVSGNGIEAVRWESGMLTPLGDLPGGFFSSNARAVSFDGEVIVGFGYAPQHREATIWIDGSPAGLGHPAGAQSDAFGVSADGKIVVGYFEQPQPIGLPKEQAMRWEGGVATPLGFIDGTENSIATAISANGRVIVGRSWTHSDAKRVAFRWENGQMEELAGLEASGTSSAMGVSADGSVIVGYLTNGPLGDDVQQAFRWENGVVETLGANADGGVFSFAVAASADGTTIVGAGEVPEECCSKAYIWDAIHGARRLEDALFEDYGFSIPGWELTEATGISLDGRTIVGNGVNPRGDFEGWVITIPEPSALLLALGGLAALAVIREKHRGSACAAIRL